jgi:hypothetical protein
MALSRSVAQRMSCGQNRDEHQQARNKRYAANVRGGTSATPNLMNTHTVLQSTDVRLQTISVINCP